MHTTGLNQVEDAEQYTQLGPNQAKDAKGYITYLTRNSAAQQQLRSPL